MKSKKEEHKKWNKTVKRTITVEEEDFPEDIKEIIKKFLTFKDFCCSLDDVNKKITKLIDEGKIKEATHER